MNYLYNVLIHKYIHDLICPYTVRVLRGLFRVPFIKTLIPFMKAQLS